MIALLPIVRDVACVMWPSLGGGVGRRMMRGDAGRPEKRGSWSYVEGMEHPLRLFPARFMDVTWDARTSMPIQLLLGDDHPPEPQPSLDTHWGPPQSS